MAQTEYSNEKNQTIAMAPEAKYDLPLSRSSTSPAAS
jgi:hypothetical protein